MTTIHETAAAENLRIYYFHATRETVVARNAMFASAFYVNHHEIKNFKFVSCADIDTRIGDVVAVLVHDSGREIEICREYISGEPEGTFGTVDEHTVPPAYFDDLMYEAMRDIAYEPKDDDPSHMYDDILQPLKPDFHLLTQEQLVRLSQSIVARRDNGDIWPTLEYIINNHYDIYLEHMHEIIIKRNWNFQGALDNLLFEKAI